MLFCVSHQLLATFYVCESCIGSSAQHLMRVTDFDNEIWHFRDIFCTRHLICLRYIFFVHERIADVIDIQSTMILAYRAKFYF